MVHSLKRCREWPTRTGQSPSEFSKGLVMRSFPYWRVDRASGALNLNALLGGLLIEGYRPKEVFQVRAEEFVVASTLGYVGAQAVCRRCFSGFTELSEPGKHLLNPRSFDYKCPICGAGPLDRM